MSQAPAMPVFTDALIGDTTHLTTCEFGAYCLILFVTWRNNGHPLPDDDSRLARVCRMTLAQWRKSRTTLAAFFDLSDGTWRQKRLEKEWEYVSKYSRSQSAKGKLSAESRALKNNNRAKADVAAAEATGGQPEVNPHTHTQYKKDDDVTSAGAGSQKLVIGNQILAQLGLTANDPRWYGHFQRIEAWISSGADAETILTTTAAVIAKKRDAETAWLPQTLNYFDRPIADAVLRRTKPMPEGNPPHGPSTRPIPTNRGRATTDERRNLIAEILPKWLDDDGGGSFDGDPEPAGCDR